MPAFTVELLLILAVNVIVCSFLIVCINVSLSPLDRRRQYTCSRKILPQGMRIMMWITSAGKETDVEKRRFCGKNNSGAAVSAAGRKVQAVSVQADANGTAGKCDRHPDTCVTQVCKEHCRDRRSGSVSEAIAAPVL